jgi:hypothetical protein
LSPLGSFWQGNKMLLITSPLTRDKTLSDTLSALRQPTVR